MVLYIRIIPYQELLGNYDLEGISPRGASIIPYQELLGNYDKNKISPLECEIIPYQELLGNYDIALWRALGKKIIPYQELLGNYDFQIVDNVDNLLQYIIPYQHIYAKSTTNFPAGLATACGFCYNLGLLSNLGF